MPRLYRHDTVPPLSESDRYPGTASILPIRQLTKTMPDSLELEKSSADEILRHIGPGKVIRSEVFEWVVKRIRELKNQVGQETGRISVPNLIGQTLGTAIDTLGQFSELRLGRVLDTSGALVDSSDAKQRSRVLLAQFPPPNDQASPDTVVEFLAAPLDESEAAGPVIDEDGLADSVAIDTLLKIPGSNFPSAWPDDTSNSVTFDGVEGTVQPASSSPSEITVRVPKDIPNAPTGTEDKEVTVKVTVEGQSDSTTITVKPPPSDPAPRIDSLPQQAEVGETITISGSNFSGTASDNTVIFGGTTTIPETAQTDSLEVEVPSVSGLGPPGSFKEVTVKVDVDARKSNGRGITVVVPSP